MRRDLLVYERCNAIWRLKKTRNYRRKFYGKNKLQRDLILFREQVSSSGTLSFMNKSSGFLPVKRRSLEVSDRDYKKLGEKNKFDTRELNLSHF
jgi:hypothetical protein